MLQELFEFVKQNAINGFNSLGSLIAFYLLYLDLTKKRVSIDIELEQEKFFSRRMDYGDYLDETEIEINADLKNTGLEPTTLVGVDFYSDNELLNKLDGIRLYKS